MTSQSPPRTTFTAWAAPAAPDTRVRLAAQQHPLLHDRSACSAASLLARVSGHSGRHTPVAAPVGPPDALICAHSPILLGTAVPPPPTTHTHAHCQTLHCAPLPVPRGGCHLFHGGGHPAPAGGGQPDMRRWRGGAPLGAGVEKGAEGARKRQEAETGVRAGVCMLVVWGCGGLEAQVHASLYVL
jgi:hypothetical protein